MRSSTIWHDCRQKRAGGLTEGPSLPLAHRPIIQGLCKNHLPFLSPNAARPAAVTAEQAVFRDPFPTHIFNGLSLASLFSPSSIPLGRHQPRRGKLIAMTPLLFPLPKPSSLCQRGHRIISQVQEILQNPGIVPAERCGGEDPSKFTNVLSKPQHPAC